MPRVQNAIYKYAYSVRHRVRLQLGAQLLLLVLLRGVFEGGEREVQLPQCPQLAGRVALKSQETSAKWHHPSMASTDVVFHKTWSQEELEMGLLRGKRADETCFYRSTGAV